MKKYVKALAPRFLLASLREARVRLADHKNSRRTPETVFTEIYEKNLWGGKRGEINSGAGSAAGITDSYIAMLKARAKSDGFEGLRLVDLGCGDFRVGRELLPICSSYVGVDIVKPVVDRNSELYSSEKVSFVHMNIIDDDLPDGDVCTIRQVLQHLSNDQISRILGKLGKYRFVFITEHYPEDGNDIVPNLDKPHGGGTRATRKSGVYLSEPPFDLPPEKLEQVLECRLPESGGEVGVLRTFLYTPPVN